MANMNLGEIDQDELDKQLAALNQNQPQQVVPNSQLDLPSLVQSLGQIQPPKQTSVSDSISTLLNQGQDEMREAQARSNQMQLFNVLARAGSQAGAALTPLANIKPDENAFKALDEMAKRPVQQAKELREDLAANIKNKELQQTLRRDAEKNDPSSAVSKIGRDILKNAAKQAGIQIEIPDSLALAEQEKLLPGIENMANKNLQRDYLKQAGSAKFEQKQSQQVDKLVKDMGQDLDPNRSRSGEMGKNQSRVNAAERIEALMSQFPDGNIPAIQTRELATSVAALLTQGSATAVGQINELVPHTMRGNAAKMSEWVTGNPTGQEQQQFIKMFAETAQREKEAAQRQITQAQFKKAYSTYHKLKDNSPEDFYINLSRATGLDVDEIKNMEQQPGFKGQFTSKQEKQEKPSENLSAQDKQAIEWAKKNSSDPRAKQILQMHGM